MHFVVVLLAVTIAIPLLCLYHLTLLRKCYHCDHFQSQTTSPIDWTVQRGKNFFYPLPPRKGFSRSKDWTRAHYRSFYWYVNDSIKEKCWLLLHCCKTQTLFHICAVLINGPEERTIPGNALSVHPDLPFRGLDKFGVSFLSRFEGSQMPSSVLRSVTLVDTPGVLSGEKQRTNRGYDFTKVVAWFAEVSTTNSAFFMVWSFRNVHHSAFLFSLFLIASRFDSPIV